MALAQFEGKAGAAGLVVWRLEGRAEIERWEDEAKASGEPFQASPGGL